MAMLFAAGAALLGSGGGDNNISSSINDVQTTVNTTLESASTQGSAVIKANNVSTYGTVVVGEDAEFNDSQKNDAKQTLELFVESTSATKLQNQATRTIAQASEVEVKGGFMAPTVNSDTNINVQTTAINAASSYAYTSASALVEVSNHREIGTLIIKKGGKANLSQENQISQKLKITNKAIRDVLGVNDVLSDVEQSAKTKVTGTASAVMEEVGAMVKSVTDMIGNSAIAMIAGVILVIVCVMIGFAMFGSGAVSAATGGAVGGAAGGAQAQMEQAMWATRFKVTFYPVLLGWVCVGIYFGSYYFDDNSKLPQWVTDWNATIVQAVSVSLIPAHYFYHQAWPSQTPQFQQQSPMSHGLLPSQFQPQVALPQLPIAQPQIAQLPIAQPQIVQPQIAQPQRVQLPIAQPQRVQLAQPPL